MTKKQRRKQKILIGQKLSKQELQWVKQDCVYRYSICSIAITATSNKGQFSDLTDNIFPNNCKWKENDYAKRYENSSCLIFPAGIHKITSGHITKLTIGNQSTEIDKNEIVLFEGYADGEFCLLP